MEEDEKTLRISELEDTNRRLEWRVDHARSQYHMFLTKALPLLDSTSKEEIFIELGRNWAKSLGWAKNYVGNPEGSYCNCSIGWQMETYETILDQNASVEIRAASLRSGEHGKKGSLWRIR